jgi:hypothetical protein
MCILIYFIPSSGVEPSLFCDVTRRNLAVCYWDFGTAYKSHLKFYLTFEVEKVLGCPETSSVSYQICTF